MEISSPEFEHYGQIPKKYTCQGENVNPPLIFSDVPDTARSLVLVVDDPDAPAGIWTHWLVWNLNPELAGIREGETPEDAVEGITSFNRPGYGGPCPPNGTHHYQFKVFALDKVLESNPDSHKGDILIDMEDHVLDSAELVGLYSKE